ncbi:MAG: hypothetical protein K8S27_02580 [Candidatus Omnitrophica bacterium]|nr:hypothetical protein [Candidatus Omnitrophota bacterium]
MLDRKILLIFFVMFFCCVIPAHAEAVTMRSDRSARLKYPRAEKRPDPIIIPKSWGALKAVTTHGGFDVLYFEGEGGTIYIIRGVPMDSGEYYFPDDSAVKIDRQ